MHCSYTWAYIDDIIVFFKTLEEHLVHLNNIFELLISLNIVLVSIKTFLKFLSITLLSQKVDLFSMTAAAEKIQAISWLTFLITLQDLKHYLSLTEWMQDYILYYAQIAKLLQTHKTDMLKDLAKSETKQKCAAQSTKLIKLTEKKRASFNCLQAILSKGSFLNHFDFNCCLYIDLNLLKRDIEIIVYYVKDDSDSIKMTDIWKVNVQSIMFLSKLLFTAESHYWLTELEMTDLIWAIKKLHHLIDFTVKSVIIYTDPFAVISIARQTTLSSSNTDELNNWLIWVS